MDQARLNAVLSDEEFVKELLAMKTAEQVQDALEDKGISVTADEIHQVGGFLRKVKSGEISQDTVNGIANGELSEAELEEVAGGFVQLIPLILGVVGSVLFGTTVFAVDSIW